MEPNPFTLGDALNRRPGAPTLAELVEQDPSLLNKKGMLLLLELERSAAEGCTVTMESHETGEVETIEIAPRPDVAIVQRHYN